MLEAVRSNMIPFFFVTSMMGTALADEVCIRGGGCFQGEILEQNASSVTLAISPGRITLPRSTIGSLKETRSFLSVYRERSRTLAASDVEGWLDLGRWASERGLATQANAAFEHVLTIDPMNADANQALGKVLMGDRWLSTEDAFRARGYVSFEGEWISKAERDSLLEQRRIESEAARVQIARVEAEARRTEAEARARVAEAEAKRIESEATADQAVMDQGWWGFGGPCMAGGNCPPPIGCAPYMDGPACRSDSQETEQRATVPPKRHRPRHDTSGESHESPTPPSGNRHHKDKHSPTARLGRSD